MHHSFLCVRRPGLASLPAILGMALLLLAVGLAMMSLSLGETMAIGSASRASQALSYAEAGARDALLRIARNKAYTCATTECYSLPLITSGCDGSPPDGCAYVTVSSGTGTSSTPKTITSKGYLKNNSRTVQVDVYFDDALDGQITSTTWREI